MRVCSRVAGEIMTTLTAQQIACVYAWLAQLFSRELDDEQLTQIASAQMAEWFSLLKSEPPLTAAVNGLENSIATLTVRDDARLELAADFCGLFLMTDKQAALPYASAYKQDEQEIKRLLVEAGMETSGNFNEPADHLAIYLDLLSHLHFSLGEGTVPARRIDGLRQKTLTALREWLPEFAARCRQYDSFGFYAALSQLLLVLVECDYQKR
ncbi:torD [Escherichia coli O25b:H4]|nr:torD [Escherichia coli O25b:H4]CDN81458.1 chaperone protein TorD [Escherichia coli O25b:H4-ST131]